MQGEWNEAQEHPTYTVVINILSEFSDVGARSATTLTHSPGYARNAGGKRAGK